jgi:Zn-finger nucleic acid-binding protein
MILVRDRDYFQCEHCGSFHFPKETDEGVRPLGQSAGLRCPGCGRELEEASIEGHLVKTCPNCRGILARRRAFAIIVEKRRLTRSGTDPFPRSIGEAGSRRLACPGCGRLMDTHPYLGPGAVMVDTCGECCLIWLDPGELTVIERA